MKNKILCIVLVLSMLVACVATTGIVQAKTVADGSNVSAPAVDAVSANSQGPLTNIQGGNILHCFNWSYSAIKANLTDIKNAGYTAIQVSPVQKPKDYNSSWTDTDGQWWKLYQPLTLNVADDNSSWLGSKSDLTSLCVSAHMKGIKVIADIVVNHMANVDTHQGTQMSYLNPGIESVLKSSSTFWHINDYWVDDYDRYRMTVGSLGQPDLNTGNSYIQSRVKDLLIECINAGVDGFRFDAAKHIEVPNDIGGNSSQFWPTVINGSQASSTKDIYYYGEILGNPQIDITNYTQYMSVTENYSSDCVLYAATQGNAAGVANPFYSKGAPANKCVLWVESHDTYMGDTGSGGLPSTKNVSNDTIKKAWAITGARADASSLFLARPNSTMGLASSDTTWKSVEVAEVNKFNNFFNGTTEYLASSGSIAYIERGTAGVVLSNLSGGSAQVNVTANRMASGTYKDQISGNTFTVANGRITGSIGSSGIAVVYNTGTEATTAKPTTQPTTAKPTTQPTTAKPTTQPTTAKPTTQPTTAKPTTQPATAKPTTQPTTAKPTTQPTTAQPTTLAPGVYLIGDANVDFKVDVSDATAIQKHIAELQKLTDNGIVLGDADGDGRLGVKDATCIQKFIAQIKGSKNAGQQTTKPVIQPTTAAPTTQKVTVAPTTQKATVAPTTQKPTVAPTTQKPTTAPATDYTLTFSNSLKWSGTIKCYYWSDSNDKMTTWPGVAMTYLSTNTYGESVYTVKVPKTATYVIFNNGSNQTVDIKLTGTDKKYYAKNSKDSNGHYLVEEWQ